MKITQKMFYGLVIIFFTSLILYIIYSPTIKWMKDILPEFMGVSLLVIIITLTINKYWDVTFMNWFWFTLAIIGVALYVYGRIYDIQLLIDLSPGFIGSTLIGALFGLIYGRKVIL